MAGFAGELPPPAFNMARYVVGRSAARLPEKIALEVRDDASAEAATETWTFHAIERAVLAIAEGLLSRGLERGDRILIRFDNTSAYALLFFGAAAAGLVPIPASSQLSETEAEFLRENSGAKLVALSDTLHAKTWRPASEILSAADVAAMIARGPSPQCRLCRHLRR